MAAAFDIERLTVKGNATPVVEGVLLASPLNGMAQYSFSAEGALVVRAYHCAVVPAQDCVGES